MIGDRIRSDRLDSVMGTTEKKAERWERGVLKAKKEARTRFDKVKEWSGLIATVLSVISLCLHIWKL